MPEKATSLKTSLHLDRLARGESIGADGVRSMLESALSGDASKVQLAAFLMAVSRNGMSDDELFALTDAYVASGERIPRARDRHVADKHSTGGVGDKLSFVVCPLVAAAGGRVRKMSGRSLAHCGGTIDKLEAIPGFRHLHLREEFIQEVERLGFSIVPQSQELCPGDALTYAIRDECGCTGNLDLIAASVMSKKISAGANGLVVDVKVGNGSLLPDAADARRLADRILAIAKRAELPTCVYLTNMSQPLGSTIGGAAELGEALEVLAGSGSSDLETLSLAVSDDMLRFSEPNYSPDERAERLRNAIASGAAASRLASWIESRGGSADFCRKQLQQLTDRSCPAANAENSGWVTGISALKIGQLSRNLRRENSRVPGSVGLVKKIGDHVREGEALAYVMGKSSDFESHSSLLRQLAGAFSLASAPPESQQVIYARKESR